MLRIGNVKREQIFDPSLAAAEASALRVLLALTGGSPDLLASAWSKKRVVEEVQSGSIFEKIYNIHFYLVSGAVLVIEVKLRFTPENGWNAHFVEVSISETVYVTWVDGESPFKHLDVAGFQRLFG